MYENILLSIEDSIATIALNRPKSMNALTHETFQELKDAFVECANNDDVRAVVVTGSEKCFSSGGDMDGFKKMLEGGTTAEQAKKSAASAGEMTYAARQCFKPTVAMISGACFGAGMSLALACDFRVIDSSAKMNTAFIGVGFTGDTGAIFHLKEMLGLTKMQELMMLAPLLGADDIMRLGLATQLAEDGKLRETAYKLAGRLAKGPTASYANQKRLFWEFFYKDYDSFADLEAKYMGESTQTRDFLEAVSAFMEKRKPNFTGK